MIAFEKLCKLLFEFFFTYQTIHDYLVNTFAKLKDYILTFWNNTSRNIYFLLQRNMCCLKTNFALFVVSL